MVKLLRIDDRLIHGQVAVYWVKAVEADTIVVADDKHAGSAMLKMTLNVGKPSGVKMEVLRIEDAIAYINKPSNSKNKMLVVTGSCRDALKIAEGCEGVKDVNLGGIRHAEGRVSVARQIFVTKEDIEALGQIEVMGKNVFLQEIPSKDKISFNEVKQTYEKNK